MAKGDNSGMWPATTREYNGAACTDGAEAKDDDSGTSAAAMSEHNGAACTDGAEARSDDSNTSTEITSEHNGDTCTDDAGAEGDGDGTSAAAMSEHNGAAGTNGVEAKRDDSGRSAAAAVEYNGATCTDGTEAKDDNRGTATTATSEYSGISAAATSEYKGATCTDGAEAKGGGGGAVAAATIEHGGATCTDGAKAKGTNARNGAACADDAEGADSGTSAAATNERDDAAGAGVAKARGDNGGTLTVTTRKYDGAAGAGGAEARNDGGGTSTAAMSEYGGATGTGGAEARGDGSGKSAAAASECNGAACTDGAEAKGDNGGTVTAATSKDSGMSAVAAGECKGATGGSGTGARDDGSGTVAAATFGYGGAARTDGAEAKGYDSGALTAATGEYNGAAGVDYNLSDNDPSDDMAPWLSDFEPPERASDGSGAPDTKPATGAATAQLAEAVTGRLRTAEADAVWRAHSEDKWLHDVRMNGLQLPLANGKWPPSHQGRANSIKPEHMEWTRTAVAELVAMGSVTTWESMVAEGIGTGARPHCVMPLLVGEKGNSTPEALKLRLCHDCRFLNQFVTKKAFKLERLPDYLKQLSKGDLQIVIDITSAYHHIEIHPKHRTLCGFEFEGILYCYACLPFGLGISAFVFCLFTAVTAAALRASGLTKAMIWYVDDCIASAGPTRDDARVAKIVAFIRSFGWHLADPKLDLRQVMCIKGLGFMIDTQSMTLDLPAVRRLKLIATAEHVITNRNRISARNVARLVGQIQSAQPAFGLICRLKSRYLSLALLTAARGGNYSIFVSLNAKAENEVRLWASSVQSFAPQPIQPHRRRPDYVLTCDASARALGAIVTASPGGAIDGTRIFRELEDNELLWGSTLREMTGYDHGIETLEARQPLTGCMIEIVGDSSSADIIFGKGGSQVVDKVTGELLLTEAVLRIFERASVGKYEVRFRWVRRNLLQDADDLSKFRDRMSFSLRPYVMALVDSRFGPWDIDRYASATNHVCPRFNTIYDTANAEAVDALSQDWSTGHGFVLPDFHSISMILDHIERCNARVTLIVPEWRKCPWWPRLWAGAMAPRIRKYIFLSADALEPRNEWCFFGTSFRTRIIVLDIIPLH